MGKLTWQARPEWQFVGRFLNEDATISNANAGRSVAAEAAYFQEQPNSIFSLEALAVPTSNLEWHVHAAAVRSELNSFPQSRDFDTIGHVDSFGDGSRTVNYTNQQFSNRDRDELSTNLAWFTDGAAGDHELRVGVDYANLFFRSQNNSTGGGYSFGDRFGQPYTLLFSPIEAPAENEGTLLTTYVQDTWRVNPNLTIKLGLPQRPGRVHERPRRRSGGLVQAAAAIRPRLGHQRRREDGGTGELGPLHASQRAHVAELCQGQPASDGPLALLLDPPGQPRRQLPGPVPG